MRLPNGQEITTLREAQAIMTSAFPEFIRKASYEWVVRGWEKFQTTYQDFYGLVPDFVDPVVTFYERAGMTTLPQKGEGENYQTVGIATTPLLTFKPQKRGAIIAITDEMVRFDKSDQINNLAVDFGVASKRTMEQAAWELSTTPSGSTTTLFGQSSVYQSASSASQPWVNQSSLQFTGDNLIVVMNKIRRQTDAQGNLLNYMPDSMLVPIEGRHAVEQWLDSRWLGFTGSGTAGGTSGVPTDNPYQARIKAIHDSPFFVSAAGTAYTSASFPWVLFDKNSGDAYTILEVAPLEVLHEDPQAAASTYFERDEIRMRSRLYNCPAVRNPKSAYFSNFNY